MITVEDGKLSVSRLSVCDIASEYGTPTYIYDMETIKSNIDRITNSVSYKKLSLHFACMANNSVKILQFLRSIGVGAFVCSAEELFIAQSAGIAPSSTVLTTSSMNDEHANLIAESGANIIADNMEQIKHYAACGITEIGLRITPHLNLPRDAINPSFGPLSRLGIIEDDFDEAIKVSRECGVKIIGTHMYIGTNILHHEYYREALDRFIDISSRIDSINYVDIGGGFGVQYAQQKKPLDWSELGKIINSSIKKLNSRVGKELELKMEPGRSIIASAGILVAKIDTIKHQDGNHFIVTDTSLSNFIRPYLYKQFHEIIPINLSDSVDTWNNVKFCGNTIASNDYLSDNLRFQRLKQGDLVAIKNAGAYGYSMSSNFCGRLKPAEVLVSDGKVELIRKRQEIQELLNGQVFEKDSNYEV